MLFDSWASPRRNRSGYYTAQWYLSRAYSNYDTIRHGAFVIRWNKDQEQRRLQEWIVRRVQK